MNGLGIKVRDDLHGGVCGLAFLPDLTSWHRVAWGRHLYLKYGLRIQSRILI